MGPRVELDAPVQPRLETKTGLARFEAKVDAPCERIEERPATYNAQIHALGDVPYSLRHPLLVTIEAYDDEVVARVPEFDLYASGPSDSLALMRLKAEIVSTYERLTELGPEKLGALPLQCLRAMRQVIEEVDA